jgi:hypothetical protein
VDHEAEQATGRRAPAGFPNRDLRQLLYDNLPNGPRSALREILRLQLKMTLTASRLSTPTGCSP